MLNLKGKKLLVLGGNHLSCEIIKRAKQRGIYVIVTDYLINSPGKSLANKSFDISVADVDKIVDLIEKEKVDGVLVGFTDSILQFYRQICEMAALPCYAAKEQIDISTNKALFKSLCGEHGIPVVKEYKLHNPIIQEDISKMKFPVLLKPVDNSGSRGIIICRDEREVFEAYQQSKAFSPTARVIAEDYMEDEEVTIHYLVQDGEVYLTAMADRYTVRQGRDIIPVPSAYIFPSRHLKAYQQELDGKVREMFKAINISNGSIFIQSFVKDGHCIFYEMGFRLTASMDYKIVDKITGINPLDMMINYALTAHMDEENIIKNINPNFKSYGCNITFSVRPGKIGRISGIHEARAIPGVLDIVNSHDLGDEIPASAKGTLMQVVLRVFVAADTIEQLASIIDKVTGTIKVYSIDGSNMLLKLFDSKMLLRKKS